MVDKSKPPGPSGTGASDKSARSGTGVRDRVQAMMERADKDRKRELFRRRIDLARKGVRSYENRKHAEAARAFLTYLRILEDWKGVPEGSLSPSLFDFKTDLPELVLMAGVYWDLAKLYDRTKHKETEFRHYLEKYILFTKGMPHHALGSETLRKYIRNEKPVHRDEFVNAYKIISGSKCFVATALFDVCDPETIERLRVFRDGRLLRSSGGRAFVRWYYRNGPWLAARSDRMPLFIRRIAGRALDRLARALKPC